MWVGVGAITALSLVRNGCEGIASQHLSGAGYVLKSERITVLSRFVTTDRTDKRKYMYGEVFDGSLNSLCNSLQRYYS
jgi:hypothetical protein